MVLSTTPQMKDNRKSRWSIKGWILTLLVFYIYFTPLASGSRAISPQLGSLLLILCDASLLIAFMIIISRRANYWSIYVAVLTAYAVTIFLLGSGSDNYTALYLGIRKSLYILIAIGIGLSLDNLDFLKILRAIYIALILICLYGIKQSISMSSFDLALIGQQGSAGYTNSIDGRLRAISVLSSGFHLGMAACCLISIAISNKKFTAVNVLVIIIAFAAIEASVTRTFMIIAFGLIALRVLPFNLKSIAIFSILASITTITLSTMGHNIFATITTTLLEDDRFANRGYSYTSFVSFRSYENALAWLGFGPGSAGSTMSSSFASGYWIEPHSIYLKYIFEFGNIMGSIIIASLIFITIAGATKFKATYQYSPKLPLMLSAIIAISGLTITSVEAAPISIYIGLLMGGCVKIATREDVAAKTSMQINHP